VTIRKGRLDMLNLQVTVTEANGWELEVIRQRGSLCIAEIVLKKIYKKFWQVPRLRLHRTRHVEKENEQERQLTTQFHMKNGCRSSA